MSFTPAACEHDGLLKQEAGAPLRAFFTISKASGIAWAILLGATWFWTCRQLSLAWSSFPNYQFGYFVPWIALLLAFRRIQAAPGCLDSVAIRPAGRFFATLGVAVAWSLFFFAELARQFDPHWRMVGCMMMASVTLLTAAGLWRRGGKKLFRALAFPVAFAWTAVPWPTNLEEFVTLGLRDLVTKATVAALHATGIAASHHGNIIDLPNGSVIIDSACSGISSLQASIMAALFLGEFFRFRAPKRFLMLAGALFVAVAGNLVRAFLLVRLANDWGADALIANHDLLGHAETAGIFIALCVAAWFLSLKSSAPLNAPAEPAPLAGASPAPGAGTGNEGWAALLAFALLPLLTWGWFALSPGGPIRAQNAPLWLLRANPLSTAWSIQPVALPPGDISTLNFTEGQTISLAGPLQPGAVIYHFFWKTDASTGFGHTPDSCMVGAGWEKVSEPVSTIIRTGTLDFPGKLYRFKRDGEQKVVFQSVWYGGDPLFSSNDFPYARGSLRGSRLAMLWKEPRRRGLESLNVYMTPSADQGAQTQAVEEVLAQVLIPNRNE